MKTRVAFGSIFAIAVLAQCAVASAANEASDSSTSSSVSPAAAATVTIASEPPAAKDASESGPVPDAPPPRPWTRGLVVEGATGVLGYFGAFRRLAPPAFLERVAVGYEIFDWLSAFGAGEIAFTDTSVGQDASKARAFPIWGLDVGARVTARPWSRVGLFVEADAGLLKADVPANTLAVTGFPKSEALRPAIGARVGVEWLQIDHHLAFGADLGPRLATGFERAYGKGDTPLMGDAAITIKYTF